MTKQPPEVQKCAVCNNPIERKEPINVTPAPEHQEAPLSRLKASIKAKAQEPDQEPQEQGVVFDLEAKEVVNAADA